MREEKRPGKWEKEEKARKNKKKRHPIFAKEEKGIQQKIGKRQGGPYVEIARNAIHMKPDDHQTSDGPYTIEQGECIFLWDVSYLGLYPAAYCHKDLKATCSRVVKRACALLFTWPVLPRNSARTCRFPHALHRVGNILCSNACYT